MQNLIEQVERSCEKTPLVPVDQEIDPEIDIIVENYNIAAKNYNKIIDGEIFFEKFEKQNNEITYCEKGKICKDGCSSRICPHEFENGRGIFTNYSVYADYCRLLKKSNIKISEVADTYL